MAFVLVLNFLGGSDSKTDTTDNQVAVQGESLAETGTLVLKVNPEIAIDYDKNGKVTAVRGINDDGVEVVKNYPDFIGKNSEVVLEELIALIGEAGYFVEEVEGEGKQIIIELEAGSALPNDDFLEKMAVNAQKAVETYKLNSEVSFDGNTYISLNDAKQIAFEHAGVDGSKAQIDDLELDVLNGEPTYEFEFKVDGVDYEYDIHALTGKVIKFEFDKNDDNKDDSGYDDSAYDDSAYGETSVKKPAAKDETQKATRPETTKSEAKPAAKKPAAQKPAAQKPAAKKPAAKKQATKPATKKQTSKPATSKKTKNAGTDYSDYSDYDDSDYDDSDYDDDSDYSDYDDDSDYSDYSDYD